MMQDIIKRLPNKKILYSALFIVFGTLVFYFSFSNGMPSTVPRDLGSHSYPLSLQQSTKSDSEIHEIKAHSPVLKASPIEAAVLNPNSTHSAINTVQATASPTPSPFLPAGSWLIGVSSSIEDLGRRMLIRNTWQIYAKTRREIETVFVIGRPQNQWREIIEREQETYGDILILEDLEGNHHNANTRKSCDWLVHVVEQAAATGRHPQYISKADSDTIPNLPQLYEGIIRPRLSTKPSQSAVTANSNGTLTTAHSQDFFTVIGLQIQWSDGFPHPYPQGSFYSLSWPCVLAIAHAHKTAPVLGEHEDVLIGRYLYDQKVKYTFVDWRDSRHLYLLNPEKSELDGDPLRSEGIRSGEILAVHPLKEDEKFVAVADLMRRVRKEMEEDRARMGEDWEKMEKEIFGGRLVVYPFAVDGSRMETSVDHEMKRYGFVDR